MASNPMKAAIIRLELPEIHWLSRSTSIGEGDCISVPSNAFIAFRFTLNFARSSLDDDIRGIRALASQGFRLRSSDAINLQRQSDNESVSFRFGQTMCQGKRCQAGKKNPKEKGTTKYFS